MIDDNKFKLYQIACLEEQAAFNDLHSGFLLKYYKASDDHGSYSIGEGILNDRPYTEGWVSICDLENRYVEAMERRINAHKDLLNG